MDICESQTVGELLVDPKKGMILNMRGGVVWHPPCWAKASGGSGTVLGLGIRCK